MSLPKRVIGPLPSILFLVLLSASAYPSRASRSADDSNRSQDHLEIMETIYGEVKDLGKYPGEDFIKREFFIGLDDDDTNKDQHVVVLIQTLDGQEIMTIQITDLEKTKSNPNVRNAKSVKNLSCFVAAGKVTMRSSDYAETDLKSIALSILKAVRDKKKLLKECTPKIKDRP
jgi:hypothetical protein